MAPAQFSSTRYELRKTLGRGGNGVVYEAFDTKTSATVALKTMDVADGELLYRLKQEFRSLADLQHPNLVRFGELACHDNQWFFTMELVRGNSLIDYVRPHAEAEGPAVEAVWETTIQRMCDPTSGVAPIATDEAFLSGGSTFDETRLRSAFTQLTSVLSALHDAGRVHRDVKPSNVLVDSSDRIVLLDFGVVAVLAKHGASADGIVGTPTFMAPEQLVVGAVGPAADWYALGTTLFIALTGKRPFVGTFEEMMIEKLGENPPEPARFAPDVPRDLNDLCVRLLLPDAADRPKAREILACFERRPRVSRPAGLAPAEPTIFVGRSAELDRLRRATGEVEGGSARAVVVEGEPGVGKTALVQKLIDELPESAVVLSGRCYEQEVVPFGGVDSLVDALSEWLLGVDEYDLQELTKGGVHYLSRVFPVLNRVPGIAASAKGQGEVDNPTALRRLAFSEFGALVSAIARKHLLVIFIDDFQWVDEDSLQLLEQTALPGSGAACLFVATLRTAVELPRAVTELRATAERVELHGLDDDEARALWRALASGDETASHDREAVLRESAGHPFFLAELVRSAHAGQRERHAGARLQDVLWDRVCGRDATERPFLEMLAIAGAPTPYAVIANAAGVDVGECSTRLGALRAAQLVRITRAKDADRYVEPYHDRIREAVLDRLRKRHEGRLEELHLRLGRALLDATPEAAIRSRIFQIVHHLNTARELASSAEERRRLAELNLLASQEARLATAYERAREHARIGIELVGKAAWSNAYLLLRDLHMAQMEAEHLCGSQDKARSLFSALQAHVSGPEDKTALYFQWIALETGRGRYREAIESGREVLAEFGTRVPARVTMAHVLREYAAVRLAQGRRPIAALENLPVVHDPSFVGVLRILVEITSAAYYIDANLFPWILLRITQMSLRKGVCDASPWGFAGYGMFLTGAFGKHQEAMEFGRLALKLDERIGDARLTARVHFLNTYILPWARPYSEVIAALRIANDHAVKHGDAEFEIYSASVLASVHLCAPTTLAEVQESKAWAREICLRRYNDKNMEKLAEVGVRYASALRGLTPHSHNFDTPTSSDQEFFALLSDASTPTALFYYHFHTAEAAFYAGDMRRAAQHLAEANKRVQTVFASPSLAELAYFDALVAARACDGAPVWARARHIARVVRYSRKLDVWAKSCPANFEPLALTVRAELLRCCGRHDAAIKEYERAVASARSYSALKFEAIALELWAAHAESRRMRAETDRLRREASDAYRRWGAVVKADTLVASRATAA